MLTATKVKALKGREKPYKVGDKDGLYLDVRPNGSKYWRFRYRWKGRQKLLALGVYPDVSLAKARDRTRAARDALTDGVDPAAEKKRLKQRTANSFRVLAEEWHEKQRHLWTENHAERVLKSLEDNVFGELGAEPAEDITAQDLLGCLRKIENRGALETASRVLQRCNAVYRYAIASGRVTYNPAADLRGALKAPKFQHYKALDRKELPELLKKLDEYDGDPVTKCAVRFMMLTFVRTTELRFAQWPEIDWKEGIWTVPANRMKMKREHLVPLSEQAIDVLEELWDLNEKREYIFASPRKPRQPISENTVLYALYRMGYHSRATGHGFRATASTILHELGFNPDAIERQLAHVERNKVKAAYNRSEYLEERIRIMQTWADQLDVLKTGAAVIPIQTAQGG